MRNGYSKMEGEDRWIATYRSIWLTREDSDTLSSVIGGGGGASPDTASRRMAGRRRWKIPHCMEYVCVNVYMYGEVSGH
jgi:hypothetical protein